jgi:hypothetical protein
MKLPWVSRERLEDAERRIAELEAERRALWDRSLQMAGQPAFFTPTSAPPAAAPVEEPEPEPVKVKESDEPEREIVAGSLTPDFVRAKFRRASVAGKIGVYPKTIH